MHLHIVATRKDDGKVFDINTETPEGKGMLAVLGCVDISKVDTYQCEVRHGEQPSHECTLIYKSTKDRDHTGDWVTHRYLYTGEFGLEDALYDASFHGLYNGELRCHHEYDCCGQWYCDEPTVRQVGDRILIKQSWSRNV